MRCVGSTALEMSSTLTTIQRLLYTLPLPKFATDIGSLLESVEPNGTDEEGTVR